MDKKDILSLSVDDFKRYFMETYLKISKDQGKTWEYEYVYDYSVDEASNESKIVLYEEGKKKSYKADTLEFDLTFPASGLYHNGKETVYFMRRSERQNKKGFCERTVKLIPFLSLFPDLPPNFHRGYTQMSVKNLNAFFITQKDKPLKWAKEKIGKDGVLSLCLDRNFGISCGIWTKLPTLWYRFVPIGEINKQKIQIYSETFFQEAKDKFENEGHFVELLIPEKKEIHRHVSNA